MTWHLNLWERDDQFIFHVVLAAVIGVEDAFVSLVRFESLLHVSNMKNRKTMFFERISNFEQK
jgi:hypothetical protein